MKTVSSHKLGFVFWVLLFQLFVQGAAFSQSVLNYQGRVISGGTAFNGTGQFKFAIVSSDGATFYWKNDGTTTADTPATAVSLPVNKGLFSVQLGDAAIANMGTINSTVISNAGMKLRVWFNDGVKNWQQFSPDQSLLFNSRDYASSVQQQVKTKSFFYGNWTFPAGDNGNQVMSRANATLLTKGRVRGFWDSADSDPLLVSAFTLDLNHQIPYGSKIVQIDVDCYDSVAETVTLTGSVKVDLIQVSDEGVESVKISVGTGGPFKDGFKRLSLDKLELFNDGKSFFRLRVMAENKAPYWSYYQVGRLNGAAGQTLRLDSISVKFE
jgi:hypothetical protein